MQCGFFEKSLEFRQHFRFLRYSYSRKLQNKFERMPYTMLDDAMIRRYAEKIYGFAYSKTGKTSDAADLSQEILLNLCTADFSGVENMDAFVHTVCRYTWSKFLRKNKPAWDAVTVSGKLEDYVDFTDHRTPEECVTERETYDRLHREVVYLSGVRREIIVLYYYDRMNAAEIGERLGLAPSTVRWHLSKIRSDLKERITMTDEIYRPKKLNVGHYGWWNSRVYAALESDILMQNIVYICRKTPLSVEDISRTLGVAAVYLEDKIADLCSMEYMIEKNGKYRTNFFIQDVPFKLAHLRYEMEHAPFVAEEFDRALNAVWDELTGVGFVGCDLPENDLKLDIYAYFLMRVIGRFDDRMIAELGLEHGAPMRPDGSKHWVRAGIAKEELNASPDMTDEMREYIENSGYYGLKSSSTSDGSVRSYQYDLRILGMKDYYGRNVDQNKITMLSCAAEHQRKGERGNDFEREQFALLAQEGYVTVTDGYARLNVPYISRAEMAEINRILDRAAAMMDTEAVYAKFIGYAEYIDRFIPDYVSANERAHYRTSFDPHAEVLYHLVDTGKLKIPENLGAACTIVYECIDS